MSAKLAHKACFLPFVDSRDESRISFHMALWSFWESGNRAETLLAGNQLRDEILKKCGVFRQPGRRKIYGGILEQNGLIFVSYIAYTSTSKYIKKARKTFALPLTFCSRLEQAFSMAGR